MNKQERKQAILQALCERRTDKIGNLAFEFNVTTRTIRSDIKELSKLYPIFTVKGNLCGGVYVDDNFHYDAFIPNSAQTEWLKKLLRRFNSDDRKSVQTIISKYIEL